MKGLIVSFFFVSPLHSVMIVSYYSNRAMMILSGSMRGFQNRFTAFSLSLLPRVSRERDFREEFGEDFGF